MKPQSLLGAAKKSMGDHREIHGSWVFGVEALQHVSSFYGISTKRFMASQSAQARCLGQDVAFCVWCIYDAYFVKLQEPVLLDVLCVIFIDFR